MKKIVSFFLSLMIIFTGVSVVSFGVSEGGNIIYVAQDGNDSAAGTIDAPLATLSGAKEKAKQLSGDVTVLFRGGTYTFDKTVYFNSEDKSNVTYKAYSDEKVVFTAGTPYTGFEECVVNGVNAFKKDVGKDADISVLFNESTTLNKTRYPEKGYFYPEKVKDEDCDDLNAQDIFRHYRAMYTKPGDVPQLKNESSAVVRILHWWKDELLPVKSYNAETGYIEFTKPASMTIKENDRYFLENVFEALNDPGEWYFDKPEGILYYIPQAGENGAELTLWGGSLETFIDIKGVNNLSFENIIFRGNGYTVYPQCDFPQAAYDVKSCVSVEYAENFKIKNCEFRDLGSCGVFFGFGVNNSRVENSIFNNLGAQAVYIRGNNALIDDPTVTKNITITNNIIKGYGKIFYNAVGILVIHANSIEISHNEITDGYYTAISVGWVWGYGYTVTYNNKICDNLIYNIGQGWLSDMGGIYTLGNQPGTVLSGNVIHNVAADPDEGGYGGWGIYLDEGSAYMLVEKNLAYCCGSDSYHLHYGSYNTVRNNIFALSGESQFRATSSASRCVANDGGRISANISNNIFLTDKGVRACSALGDKEVYYEENNFYWDLTQGENILFGENTDVKKAVSLETAVRKGYIHNPTVIDPCFMDAASFDFELSDDSPVVKAGFEKWNIANAGTLKGSVIGLNTNGGLTPYNSEASAVELKPSKEKAKFFYDLINKIYFFFLELIERIKNL